MVLEARDHGSDERVSSDGGQHIALVADVLDLFEADHCDTRTLAAVAVDARRGTRGISTVGLAQNLERKDLVLVTVACIAQTHQPDTRKGAGSQGLNQLKVLLAQHVGRVADRLLVRVNGYLTRLECARVLSPLRKRMLLFVAGALHGRRVLALGALVAPMIARAVRVQELVDGSAGHGCGEWRTVDWGALVEQLGADGREAARGSGRVEGGGLG